jgi:hypothetical protein
MSSPSASASSADLPAAVQAPCDGAVLHDRNPYTVCSSGGNLVDMEDDMWCCPDGSTPTTHTVVDTTETPCGPAAPDDGGGASSADDGGSTDLTTCGKVGSGCDSTVCTGNAHCTTKYGGCMCATLVQQNCTVKGEACSDNGCTTLGGTCAVYTNGTDTGCVCGK